MTIDERFDRTDQKLQELRNDLEEFRIEMVQRLDLLDQQRKEPLCHDGQRG